MYILHFAPFDPTGYPPLIHTVHVSAAWGLDSVVIATAPNGNRGVLGRAEVLAADTNLTRASLQRFFAESAFRVMRRRQRPALIIGHNVLGLPAAALAATAAGVPFVYHCHDFHVSGPPLTKLFDAAETIFGPRAAEVWVPTPERAEEATRRGIGKRALVVRNCPRRIETPPAKGRLRAWLQAQGSRSGGQGKIITRHGGIGPPHCIMDVIETLPHLPPEVELVVIGRDYDNYIAKCLHRAHELDLRDRVFFHPFVSHGELFELVVDGNVGSGLYAPDDVNTAAPAPNKVYENLALGVPVVVRAGSSLSSDIAAFQAGLCVPSDGVPALTAAFRKLLFEPGSSAYAENARAAHLERFSYESQLGPTILGRGLAHPRTPAFSEAR